MIDLMYDEELNIKDAAKRLDIRYSTAKFIYKQYKVWGLDMPCINRNRTKNVYFGLTKGKHLKPGAKIDCVDLWRLSSKRVSSVAES